MSSLITVKKKQPPSKKSDFPLTLGDPKFSSTKFSNCGNGSGRFATTAIHKSDHNVRGSQYTTLIFCSIITLFQRRLSRSSFVNQSTEAEKWKLFIKYISRYSIMLSNYQTTQKMMKQCLCKIFFSSSAIHTVV